MLVSASSVALCGIGASVLCGTVWYGCLRNVALCGMGYPAGINIGSRVETVTDTGRGRSATKSEDEEEDGQVVKFQIFEEKEIILLSPFCKSVRPVCAPISHFPK